MPPDVLYIRICNNQVYCVEVMDKDDAQRHGEKWSRLPTLPNDHRHSFALYQLPEGRRGDVEPC